MALPQSWELFPARRPGIERSVESEREREKKRECGPGRTADCPLEKEPWEWGGRPVWAESSEELRKCSTKLITAAGHQLPPRCINYLDGLAITAAAEVTASGERKEEESLGDLGGGGRGFFMVI